MAEEKQQRPRLQSVWRQARELVWQNRGRLALGLILVVISRISGLVLPWSSKYVIDDVITGSNTDLLNLIALAVGVATLIQSSTTFALSQLLGVAAQRAINDMRKNVQQHVIRLPPSYFDSTKSGVLISRVMTDAEGLRNLVGTGLVQLIGAVLTISVSLSVLFYLNWKLTTVTLAVLILFGVAMAMAFNRLRPLFKERGEINADVTGRLAEALGGVKVVKGYTAEPREDRVFGDGVDRLFRNVASSITAVSAAISASSLVFGIIGVLMMVFGGQAVIRGEMTLGDLIRYIFFTGMAASPMVSISSVTTQLGEAFAGLDRIHELRTLETERDLEPGREALTEIRGDVAFDNVHFEYEPDTPVLKGVSFEAPAGTTTALVGSSGSGKSTLISLVMAFNRPQSGRVRIDGRDLATVKLYDFRSHLGIVLQENFLFDGTVADNIAYARPDTRREQVLAAARIAHCDPFVQDLPDGYDTRVGERGVKLSGGQRQRIAIARAIVADPTLLILDEATSSLDSESEAMIQDGLESLRKGRTTFVIAHRLSTIQSADQILVLEDGQIVERGTHAELLELDGRYRELHDKQYRLERNRFINPGEDFTPEPAAVTVPKAASDRPPAL